MTEEQKVILIAKMIDVPQSLSDDDLEAILTDDELRDIYEVSSTVRGACIRQPEMDMAEEWQRFRRRTRRKPTKMDWIMRVAAIFTGVMLVSGFAAKILDYSLTTDKQTLEANTAHTTQPETILTITCTIRPSESQENTITEPTIRGKQAAASSQHHAKTKTVKPKGKLEPEETNIDIDEYLRIQQARIDNDLALQVAEAYMEEYHRLLPILVAAGSNNTDLDNMIRRTTMQ